MAMEHQIASGAEGHAESGFQGIQLIQSEGSPAFASGREGLDGISPGGTGHDL